MKKIALRCLREILIIFGLFLLFTHQRLQPVRAGEPAWQFFRILKDQSSIRIWSIDFPTSQIGYAVGGDDWRVASGKSFIFKTADGGNTWTEQNNPFPETDPNFYSGVQCKDGNNCLISGQYGNILKTANGGNTWEIVPKILFTDEENPSPVPYSGYLNALEWTGQGDNYLIGVSRPYIFHSSNGRTFTQSPINHGYSISAFDCPTPQNCYAGSANRVYVSSNGGTSWAERPWTVAMDFGRYIWGVSFVNKDTGWMTGVRESYPDNDPRTSNEFDSVIVRMDNASTVSPTFDDQLYTPKVSLEDIKMINSTLGYAVGGKGTIYRTVNGNDWEEMTGPNTTATLVSIFAFGPDNLIVGDDHGYIWKYKDIGQAAPTPTVTPIDNPAVTLSITPTLTPVDLPPEYAQWKQEFIGNLTTKDTDYNRDGKVDLVDFEMGRRAGKFI